jgi:alpha-glucosidase (family GH31 glycosyl hydrolase)
MMDFKGLRRSKPIGDSVGDDNLSNLVTHKASVVITPGSITFVRSPEIDRGDAMRELWLDREGLAQGRILLHYQPLQNLYGMRGTQLNFRPSDGRGNPGDGLMRNHGAVVKAGSQGDGGAPFAYTRAWGLFVDSIDGQFINQPGNLVFEGGSRKDIEAYIVLGPPKRTIEVATDLTGHPPMPPKWSLGFMNSQWKTDQATVTGIVDEYRTKQIPIDAFIFDFDFKAWGEDDYGEWRWNSTNGPGNVGPMKYPDGASGKFAKDMAAKGMKLAGIMKPRILVKNADGTTMKAAAEALANNWFMPGKKPYQDYFSHRPANDLGFSNPSCRAWFWKHAKGLFDTGIVGWWNDEADEGFDSLGFFHMQESLYEGQRSASNLRVWSLNRNFYLGAQRFGFGTWSGDIGTGFGSMLAQKTRMLDTIDLGQPHWSMDTGGFGGHPDSENYARWVEFASVVPVMRVHSTFGELRQPWVYGPIAEAAAKKAIEWRYAMIPSLYSWEHEAHETGIGIVRPLFWEFPDDPACANEASEWMLGDQLLVAPVMAKHAMLVGIYLPSGVWFDYNTGARLEGGKTIDYPVDANTWADVPTFVREGSILATQEVLPFLGAKPINTVTLDVWSGSDRVAHFTVYDDDGQTYAYERGGFFSQDVAASRKGTGTEITLSAPVGRYRTTIKSYWVRVHGVSTSSATFAGRTVRAIHRDAAGTIFAIPAGRAGTLKLDGGT